MKYNNVIFDLDGTILDTTEGILESVRYTIREMGFHMLQEVELLTFVGPPIQNSFINHYNCTKEIAQEAAGIFRNYYKGEALLKAKPYEGIYKLLDKLKSKGAKIAVATYKREDYAIRLLKYFGFDQYCASMHGADHFNKMKKEDIVRLCMQEMNGNLRDSLLIGDTIHDAKGAKEAEIDFLEVTYGFGFKTIDEINEYPHIGVVDCPLDIEKYIV